jgi:Kef-type K+ transport system membrane component KefB
MTGAWPTLLAAGGGSLLVGQIGSCLLAAAVLAVVCEKLRLPSIAAFIFAGLAIGPVGLGLVDDRAAIETIAELGLVLLLFLIGLEVNLRSLLASGRVLLVTGLLQVPLSLAAGFGLFWLLRPLHLPLVSEPYAPLYLGLACAFSSTLLVVKVLHERLQLDTTDGRLCVGLLIFQDIWAIIVLALQPNMAAPDVTPVVLTFTGVAVVVAVAGALTRYLLPPAFRVVAKSPELVVTLALGWCFGLGQFAGNLGTIAAALGIPHDISVSREMGALIAGASIATFPYAHEVVAKVSNLRDFFITLFFAALGMSIPIPDGSAVLVGALVLAAVLAGIRYLVFMPLFYASGLDRRNAVTTSTKLAQVSEFALVIAYLGITLGHVSHELVSVVIFSFVLTAIATPTLFTIADPLHERLGPFVALFGIRPRGGPPVEEKPAHGARLALLGFHRLASSLLSDLQRSHPDLVRDVLVVDFNVALHDRIRATGARCVYGDVSNPETLRHSGVAEAHVVVSTVSDDILKGTNNEAIARTVRALNPKALIIANAVRIADIPAIRAAGADYVFAWRTETARGVLPAVCAALEGDLPGFVASRRIEDGEPEARHEVLD